MRKKADSNRNRRALRAKIGSRCKTAAAFLLALVMLCITACGNQGVQEEGQSGTAGDAGNVSANGADSAQSTSVTRSGDEIVLTDSVVDIKFSDRDKDASYTENTATKITLNQTSAEVAGNGAKADGSTVAITAEGTYLVSGTLTDGQIVVDVQDSEKVQLVLQNASVHCETSAAVYVKNADKVFVTLAEGSVNTLSGGISYTDTDDNTVDGVIFSKDDLTLNGSGKLTVNAQYKHGIVSKNDIRITGGVYEIKAQSACLSAKDAIKISGGTFTLNSANKGIKAENDEDSKQGNIYISGGTFDLVTEDDALHAAGSIVIDGGSFTISAGDDAVHSEYDTMVNGGDITITKSYEGLEGLRVTVSGGKISLNASDDGVNAAGGNDGSGMQGDTGSFGRMQGGRDGGSMANNTDAYIKITGGEIYVNASGDGLDSNGSLYVSGGTVYVDGPVSSGDGALDKNGTAEITGGTVIAVGAAGMAETFDSDSSTQCSMCVNISGQAGDTLTLKDAQGNVLITFTPAKQYANVVISTAAIKQGETYTLSSGSNETSVTQENLSTNTGGAGGFGGFGGFAPGGQDGKGDKGGMFNGDMNPENRNPEDFDPQEFRKDKLAPENFNDGNEGNRMMPPENMTQ